MAGRARFTLVREGILDTTDDLNYSSYSTDYSAQDEIALVDPYGDPCARPAAQGEIDLDVEHGYSDGSEGNSPVALIHQIALDVNYIDSTTYGRLKAWHQDRARVLFSPGFGRNSLLAWRPVTASTASIPDLTGRYTLDITGDLTRDHVWDTFGDTNLMRSGFTYRQRIVATPGGAGQVFERGNTNISDPDSPEAADSGWTAGGAGSSTLTLTHSGVPAVFNAEIFGHSSCYSTVRVVGTAETDVRYLEYNLPSAASGGPDGEGTINAAVWLMGRLPTDAALVLGGTSVALDGDYSNWTRVDIQDDDASYTDGAVDLTILMPAGSDEQTCDFIVGPRMITWEANDSRYSQAYPQWIPEGAAKTQDHLETSVDFVYPMTGSLMTSFYVPDWFVPLDSMCMGLLGTPSDKAGRLYLIAYDDNHNLRVVWTMNNAVAPLKIASNFALTAGAVNTLAVTWSHDETHLYHNGAVLASLTDAESYEKAFVDEPLRIGYNSMGRGAHPCIMNTVRIDREVWSADRVANEHETLTNPGALDVVKAARGRTYKIVRLPTDHFTTSGGTYWRGQLILQQIDYDAALADITTKEKS